MARYSASTPKAAYSAYHTLAHTGNGDAGYPRLPRRRGIQRALARNHRRLQHATTVTTFRTQAAYGTMLAVRVYLVDEASSALQHATTVATRYSAVRRQGGGGGGVGGGGAGGSAAARPVERQVTASTPR